MKCGLRTHLPPVPSHPLQIALLNSQAKQGILNCCRQWGKSTVAAPRGDGHNRASLRLTNGSRIVGLPGVEATSRGFSGVRMLLVDEASRVPDDLYFSMRPVTAVAYKS